MSEHASSHELEIPVLSEVVVPGRSVEETPAPVMPASAQAEIIYQQIAERLISTADALLDDMERALAVMVEEELRRAQASALADARHALRTRMRAEMETRLTTFIQDALRSTDGK